MADVCRQLVGQALPAAGGRAGPPYIKRSFVAPVEWVRVAFAVLGFRAPLLSRNPSRNLCSANGCVT
jgi:hypothetical protein